jgi:FtsH-binding integral membrane protein
MSLFNTGGERSMTGTGVLAEFRPLMRLVYVWMMLGLLLTAVVSVVVSSNEALLNTLLNRGVFFGAIIAELVLVIALGAAFRRLSFPVAALMFFAYAALNGFTLSLIFIVYDLGAIFKAFFSATAAFAVMSVLGYTTQLDLQKYRTYFFMGLIGLVVAMVINIFLRSNGLDLIISMFGVVLFTALTAYDTQKIKRMSTDPTINSDGSLVLKLSIFGALQLYLDFINLFLFLLRLFGRRR